MAASKLLMSPDFLTRFIEEYRALTCLWQVRSADYMNKVKRDEAWEILVQVTKEKNSEADINFVKKKVDSIRASFRKELRKVRESEHSGTSTDEMYKPSLWYFELLNFTIAQEMPRESKSNLDENEAEVMFEDVETNDPTGEQFTANEQETDTSAQTPRSSLQKKGKQKSHPKDEEVKRPALVQKAFATLNQETDEFEVLGKTYAAKLRRMDVTQRDIADKLINEVLFKGLQNHLTFNTTVIVTLSTICCHRTTGTQYKHHLQHQTNPTRVLAHLLVTISITCSLGKCFITPINYVHCII